MSNTATMLRLQREIVELEKEPLEGIQYHFRDNNMRHMCLILTPQSGPFRSLRLHLEVHIPDDYPRTSPAVTIQTAVKHPNVSGSYICCDILQPRSQWNMYHKSLTGYNGGYTPAYLLKYIFYQLLSFFSVDEVDQSSGSLRVVSCWDSEYRFWDCARNTILGYKCAACGFNIRIPSSIDYMDDMHMVNERKPQVEQNGRSRVEKCSLGKLDNDCWLLILDLLADQNMHSLSRAWLPVN